MATTLTPTQRYAAGALLALALRQAQIHQSAPLGGGGSEPDDDERASSATSSSASSDAASDADLWTYDSRGLLRPVFRFLEIDPKAWAGLEETAASPEAKHHISAFLRIIFEEGDERPPDTAEQELALAKAVDVMVMGLGNDKIDGQEDATASISETDKSPEAEAAAASLENLLGVDKLSLDDVPANNRRKMALLYALLSACVLTNPYCKSKRTGNHLASGRVMMLDIVLLSGC